VSKPNNIPAAERRTILVINKLSNWHFIGSLLWQIPPAMFKNYFRTALRNFLKSRLFSIINISGLSLGMAIALLIGIWIWDELSFDTYHSNYPHIAQVMENQLLSGGVMTMNIHPYPLAKTLRDKYSGDFQRVAAFIPYQQMIAVGNKKLNSTGSFTDPEFPDI